MVLDVSNIAFSYGCHETYACKGIRLAYEYFKKRGCSISGYLNAKYFDGLAFCLLITRRKTDCEDQSKLLIRVEVDC